MSSKAAGQQQGRRTPLSLAGGGGGGNKNVNQQQQHNQQQQQQQQQQHAHHQQVNKTQQNSNNAMAAATAAARNHESDCKTKVNANNNATAANKQHEPKDVATNATQKETKKLQQQNGNKNAADVATTAAAAAAKKTNEKSDATSVAIGQNGAATNGNMKSNGNATKNVAKDETKQKEQQPEKSKKATAPAAEQKSTDATHEKPTAQVSPTTKSTGKTQATAAAAQAPSGKPNAATQKAAATATKAAGNASPSTKATAKANTAATPTKSPKGKAPPPPTEIIEILDDDVMSSLPAVDTLPTNAAVTLPPTATSTPGKSLQKTGAASSSARKSSSNKKTDSDSSSPDHNIVPARTFSQISGRRSIRQLGEYTPSKYNPAQFRESYRRINTELDVTSNTNTSMNVTVGSEVPNNSSFLSFSLFGRSRKRERTPPQPTELSDAVREKSQSAVELSTETTPPKRARLDVHGFLSAVASPLTMLRTRFSKTSIECSTPVKEKLMAVVDGVGDNDIVQNVSGVSIEEVENATATEASSSVEKTPKKQEATPNKNTAPDIVKDIGEDNAIATAMETDENVQIAETPVIAAVGEPKEKQRGCQLM